MHSVCTTPVPINDSCVDEIVTLLLWLCLPTNRLILKMLYVKKQEQLMEQPITPFQYADHKATLPTSFIKMLLSATEDWKTGQYKIPSRTHSPFDTIVGVRSLL